MKNWNKFFDFNANKYDALVNELNRDMIAEGLEHNRTTHGLPLCPCKFYPDIEEEKRTRDNVCPCKEFRETDHCHCNLFVK